MQLYNVGVLNMVLGNHKLAAAQLQRVYDVTGAESVLPKLNSAKTQANQQAFLGNCSLTAVLGISNERFASQNPFRWG